jgi:hypothetical protein
MFSMATKFDAAGVVAPHCYIFSVAHLVVTLSLLLTLFLQRSVLTRWVEMWM